MNFPRHDGLWTAYTLNFHFGSIAPVHTVHPIAIGILSAEQTCLVNRSPRSSNMRMLTAFNCKGASLDFDIDNQSSSNAATLYYSCICVLWSVAESVSMVSSSTPYIFTSSRSSNFETTSSIVADGVSARVYRSHVLPTERFVLTISTWLYKVTRSKMGFKLLQLPSHSYFIPLTTESNLHDHFNYQRIVSLRM